jgi:hypothetical protein
MAKITIDVPEDILDRLTQDGNDAQILSQRFTSILRLGLANSAVSADIYRYILSFLVSNPTPQQVLEFQPTTTMQQRLKELLGKSAAGQLTESEQQELNDYEHIEHLIIMLKTGSLRCIAA